MGCCRICGKENCKEHRLRFPNIQKIEGFSGSSPPEIFIGRWNYPKVYIGILSPQEYGNTEILSSQEIWHEKKLPIQEILKLRNRLIYCRTQSNIKRATHNSKFLSVMQEVAMTSKSIATEFKLERPVIAKNRENEGYIPIIKKAAEIKSARLEENSIIDRKLDYLVSDMHAKSVTAILELEKSKISTSSIIKVLSAGLLGLRANRKLVPTRWSITAVDDTLSKNKLKSIKSYQEISEILLFTSEYLGNHYEFLLLPANFSFEVIEINSKNHNAWQDYETFSGRKDYAKSVTGAYYSNRLALTEYLEKIKRQATCIVFREINKEYTQSMGVGILRQISRDAFLKQPEKFSTLIEALSRIQSRIKLPLSVFMEKSKLLQDYGKQKKITEWFN